MNNAMKKKSLCTILAAAAVAVSSSVATAADYFWDNGGADGRWATGDNWLSAETNNVPPQDDDTAHIGSSDGTAVATGVVDQAGTIVKVLKLGFNTGKKGTLVVAGGSLDVTDYIDVGVSGLGRLVLSNGTLRAVNTITVATQLNKPGGTIELAGGHMQTVTLVLGHNSTGTLAQSGGTNLVTYKASINNNSAGQGTYELSGGLFNPSSMDVGVSGTGTLFQTGGVLENLAQTALGSKSNSVGYYRLEGGTLNSLSLYEGNYGHGVFTQTGGDEHGRHVSCVASL